MGNFYQAVASSKAIPINRFLDTFTGSAAAYSLRRLRSGYNGPALTIRRDNDNTEQNIGWDGNDVVDVNSIINFCGSANGYVKTWYDQSTNRFDASQLTTSTQPQVYDGTTGTVTTPSLSNMNAKPAINKPNGVSNPQLVASSITAELNGGYSYYVVMGESGYNQNIFRIGSNSSNLIMMAAETTGQATHKQGNSGINVVTTGYPNVGQRIAGHGVMQSAHYDGATSGSVFITRDDGYNFIGTKGNFSSLGSTSGGVPLSLFAGSTSRPFQEFILFDEDKSSIRKEIESNLNDYYTVGQLNHNLPLDTYTNVAAAWSVRKVRSAYTGSCMEVYNGTSYADIGFTSQNELDLEALNAHCGTNDGFVSKWYSQGTSTTTFVQTDSTLMPQIYDGTTQTVFIANGKPQVQGGSVAGGDGNTTMLTSAAESLNGYPTAHNFIVMARSDRNSYSDLNAAYCWGRYGNNNDGKYRTQGGNSGGAQVGNNLHINGVASSADKANTFFSALGNNITRTVSSTQNLDRSSANPPQSVTRLGISVGNMHHLQEILIFDGDMSDDREAIEQNQNSYFKVF